MESRLATLGCTLMQIACTAMGGSHGLVDEVLNLKGEDVCKRAEVLKVLEPGRCSWGLGNHGIYQALSVYQ